MRCAPQAGDIPNADLFTAFSRGLLGLGIKSAATKSKGKDEPGRSRRGGLTPTPSGESLPRAGFTSRPVECIKKEGVYTAGGGPATFQKGRLQSLWNYDKRGRLCHIPASVEMRKRPLQKGGYRCLPPCSHGSVNRANLSWRPLQKGGYRCI